LTPETPPRSPRNSGLVFTGATGSIVHIETLHAHSFIPSRRAGITNYSPSADLFNSGQPLGGLQSQRLVFSGREQVLRQKNV
jgi:hypothetical protein